MSLPHRFDLAALAEYKAAARYYAARQPALGVRFIASIEAAIALICDEPERWGIFAGREVRRALSRTFPYSILYTIESDISLSLRLPIPAASQDTGKTVCRIDRDDGPKRSAINPRHAKP